MGVFPRLSKEDANIHGGATVGLYPGTLTRNVHMGLVRPLA